MHILYTFILVNSVLIVLLTFLLTIVTGYLYTLFHLKSGYDVATTSEVKNVHMVKT